MARKARQQSAVRDFILHNVAANPKAIGPLTAEKFNLSRTSISRYMKRLIAEGLIEAHGKTNSRSYALKPLFDEAFSLTITSDSSEDTVWRFRVLPLTKDVPKNVLDICQYGFTEMFNNVVDHSQSPDVIVGYRQTYATVRMMVIDHGIGIFEKIRADFNLPDARSALLELSKGKLTSDKARHSGEGIFFTSRMFDEFSIRSGNLFYTRERTKDDWLIETQDILEYVRGTSVTLTIGTNADWTMRQVFEQYQGDDLRFRSTHVPINLSSYPGEQLVSRSQAKRVLARFENFSEVFLDFNGVQQIGQAFADEIFRVFKNEHPNIKLVAIRTEPAVQRMIDAVQAADEPRDQTS